MRVPAVDPACLDSDPLALRGAPRCDLPHGLEAVPQEPDALTSLDCRAYGFKRAAEHRFWREQAAEANLWLLAGEPIAYSYVHGQGLIGPLAGRDGEAAAVALPAELARRESQHTDVHVPGSARRLVARRTQRGASGPRDLQLLALLGPAPGTRILRGFRLPRWSVYGA